MSRSHRSLAKIDGLHATNQYGLPQTSTLNLRKNSLEHQILIKTGLRKQSMNDH